MGAQIPTLYLLLAAVIGVFIGLLLANLFGSRDTHKKQEPPPDVVKEGYGEVAGLWYSPAGKKMLMEVEGGYYKNISKLSKDQQAKARRIVALLNDWAVEQVEPVAEPAPQPLQQDQPSGTPEALELSPEPDLTPEAFLDLVKDEEPADAEEPGSPFISDEQEEADMVSLLQESLEIQDATPVTEEVDGSAALTITQQIGAVLDNMLRGTDLEDKGIRLSENADHGVDVYVGNEKFEGIEAVPYPQVRQMIHEAVMRWEEEAEARPRPGE
ncbi:MAG: hypothetical protein AAGU17_07755 [Anaerolineaceae bacterium]|jgi:hypothetical protein